MKSFQRNILILTFCLLAVMVVPKIIEADQVVCCCDGGACGTSCVRSTICPVGKSQVADSCCEASPECTSGSCDKLNRKYCSGGFWTIADGGIYCSNCNHCSDYVKNCDEEGVNCGGTDCDDCVTSCSVLSSSLCFIATDCDWCSGISKCISSEDRVCNSNSCKVGDSTKICKDDCSGYESCGTGKICQYGECVEEESDCICEANTCHSTNETKICKSDCSGYKSCGTGKICENNVCVLEEPTVCDNDGTCDDNENCKDCDDCDCGNDCCTQSIPYTCMDEGTTVGNTLKCEGGKWVLVQTCGNNEKEGTEECDGTDDSACDSGEVCDGCKCVSEDVCADAGGYCVYNAQQECYSRDNCPEDTEPICKSGMGCGGQCCCVCSSGDRTLKLVEGYNFFTVGTVITQKQIEDAGCELQAFGEGKGGVPWKAGYYDTTLEKRLESFENGLFSSTNRVYVRKMVDKTERPWGAYFVRVLNEGGCELSISDETVQTEVDINEGYTFFGLSENFGTVHQNDIRLKSDPSQPCPEGQIWGWQSTGKVYEHYNASEKLFTVDPGLSTKANNMFKRVTSAEIVPFQAAILFNNGPEPCVIKAGVHGVPQSECGDGTIDSGEDCEEDSDCDTGEECYKCDCVSQSVQKCGDGLKTGTEECDCGTTPGRRCQCPTEKICTSDCTCVVQ